MANKFNILGMFEHFDEDQLFVNVRRNYREHNGKFVSDDITVAIGLGISQLLLKSLKTDDVIQISGRIEGDAKKNSILVAENIVRIRDLNASKS